MFKRNIMMTRQTCVVCDEPLNGKRIIPVRKSLNTYQKAVANVHTVLNGAYCSRKCINKLERAFENLNIHKHLYKD